MAQYRDVLNFNSQSLNPDGDYSSTFLQGMFFDAPSNARECIGSGTIAFSGLAVCSIEVNAFEYAGSGTITFSGSGTCSKNYIYGASGQITLSGAGTCSKNYIYGASGNITFSGTATCSKNYIYGASGSITFSGEAICSSQGVVAFEYDGFGSIVFSGLAGAIISIPYIGTGEIGFAGSSEQLVTIYCEGSGEVVYLGFAECSYSAETLIFVVHLYNGLGLAGHITPIGNDMRIKIGASQIGIPLIIATDNPAGAVRIKANGTVYALRQS